MITARQAVITCDRCPSEVTGASLRQAAATARREGWQVAPAGAQTGDLCPVCRRPA